MSGEERALPYTTTSSLAVSIHKHTTIGRCRASQRLALCAALLVLMRNTSSRLERVNGVKSSNLPKKVRGPENLKHDSHQKGCPEHKRRQNTESNVCPKSYSQRLKSVKDPLLPLPELRPLKTRPGKKGRTVPKPGDAVLVEFLPDSKRLDTASFAGENPFDLGTIENSDNEIEIAGTILVSKVLR